MFDAARFSLFRVVCSIVTVLVVNVIWLVLCPLLLEVLRLWVVSVLVLAVELCITPALLVERLFAHFHVLWLGCHQVFLITSETRIVPDYLQVLFHALLTAINVFVEGV